MMEVRTPVKPIKVELHCDHCGTKMVRQGSYKEMRKKYVYTCSGCKRDYISEEEYPRIDYEPIGESERKSLA